MYLGMVERVSCDNRENGSSVEECQRVSPDSVPPARVYVLVFVQFAELFDVLMLFKLISVLEKNSHEEKWKEVDKGEL